MTKTLKSARKSGIQPSLVAPSIQAGSQAVAARLVSGDRTVSIEVLSSEGHPLEKCILAEPGSVAALVDGLAGVLVMEPEFWSYSPSHMSTGSVVATQLDQLIAELHGSVQDVGGFCLFCPTGVASRYSPTMALFLPAAGATPERTRAARQVLLDAWLPF